MIDEFLMAHVRVIHAESGRTYGAPRVHWELKAAGLPVSPKRVARLMREDGLGRTPAEMSACRQDRFESRSSDRA